MRDKTRRKRRSRQETIAKKKKKRETIGVVQAVMTIA
jgi:hypothetical protein